MSNNEERIKSLNNTIEIINVKIEEIKRVLKYNKLSEVEKRKYKENLNKALDDLSKIKALKKKMDSK
jgi:FtsZ-binding cell division protein ZapB